MYQPGGLKEYTIRTADVDGNDGPTALVAIQHTGEPRYDVVPLGVRNGAGASLKMRDLAGRKHNDESARGEMIVSFPQPPQVARCRLRTRHRIDVDQHTAQFGNDIQNAVRQDLHVVAYRRD